MNSYRWRGIDVQGNIHQGTLNAHNESQVREVLFKQGIAVLRVRQKRWQQVSDFLERRSSSPESLIFFFSHLGALLKSGLTLIESLSLIAAQTERRTFKQVIVQLSGHVRLGLALSEALALYPAVFDQFIVSLVKAGERIGNVPNILEMLGEYFTMRLETEKKIKQAAFLPFLTIMFAFLIIGGVFTLVIPQFEGFFTMLARPLPESTILVIKISHFLRSEGALILLSSLLGLYIMMRIVVYKSNHLKLIKDRILLRLKLFGHLIVLSDLSRYLSTLSMLLKSGVPAHEALIISQSIIKNQYFKKTVASIPQAVRHGQALSAALSAIGTPFFPEQVVAQIAVGERTGKLSLMIEKAAQLIAQDHQRRLRVITTYIQPALLITVGILIAFLMAAVYLPIFDMVSLV